MDAPSASVWRSTYIGVTQLCQRLEKENEGRSLGANALDHLNLLLFGPDPGTEALRLLRADAIVALLKAAPASALSLKRDLLVLIKEERSISVRDRLAAAQQLHSDEM